MGAAMNRSNGPSSAPASTISGDDKKLLLGAALVYASPWLISGFCVIAYFAMSAIVGVIVLIAALAARLHGG